MARYLISFDDGWMNFTEEELPRALGIWGAIALGAVGAWIGCRFYKIPLPAFADAVAPGIAVAQAIEDADPHRLPDHAEAPRDQLDDGVGQRVWERHVTAPGWWTAEDYYTTT